MPTVASDIIDGLVQLPDGRSLYRICLGSGSPTVILESGDGADSLQWRQVTSGIAAVTRVCAYDRGGLGQSSEVSGCRRLGDLNADLAGLLQAADITGPYVLVGTSGGGYISAGFAAQHRDQVAGLVLLDTSPPFPNPPPDLIADTACDAAQNQERRDYLAVEHEAWDYRAEIGDIPVTIVTVKYDAPENRQEATNVKGQKGWLVFSPQARKLVVHTAHDIANADPQLVITEVTDVVTGARASG